MWLLERLNLPQQAPWGFPENASTHGGEIDRLFWILTWFSLPVLIGIIGFIVYCLVRFRRAEGRRASYITGFRASWVTWLLVAVLLLVELPMDLLSEEAWAKATMKFPKPEESLFVQVYAEQFAWNFRYPGGDGRYGTPDDITKINQMIVPVGKPIVCVLRSRDVVHSFCVPNFRVKLDVMPGATRRVWFEAAKPGKYEIACTELCGLGHYRMRGFVTVVSPEEYEAWLTEEAQELEEYGPGDDVRKWELWQG
ncbi:MAG: cytochrome c oxidase subunit II [Planctomycetes bacterium]|nr:cytochrome c oxidase subunit II [Planctomycetota bacterium]